MAENIKEEVQRQMDLFRTLYNSLPDGSDIYDTIRACEILITDCITQLRANKDERQELCNIIASDIIELSTFWRSTADLADLTDNKLLTQK